MADKNLNRRALLTTAGVAGFGAMATQAGATLARPTKAARKAQNVVAGGQHFDVFHRSGTFAPVPYSISLGRGTAIGTLYLCGNPEYSFTDGVIVLSDNSHSSYHLDKDQPEMCTYTATNRFSIRLDLMDGMLQGRCSCKDKKAEWTAEDWQEIIAWRKSFATSLAGLTPG